MALRGGIVAPINKERLEAEFGIRFRTFGTGWRYEWQSDGMLARVVCPDGKEVSFAYDALGRRIRNTYWIISHCKNLLINRQKRHSKSLRQAV